MNKNLKNDTLQHIDTIRGIAILMVICVHVSHTLSMVSSLTFTTFLLTEYGQMGVQLFFVASAYTLSLSYENREKETNKILKFFIRRYFRIAPAYYLLGILGSLSLAYLLPKYSLLEFENYTPLNILKNLFFVHGFIHDGNNNIVPGGWSIGTEMAFYALFPLLFYYTKKVITKNITSIYVIFLLIAILTQLISFLIFKDKIKLNNFVYFNFYNQLPVFFIGISYYFLEKHKAFDYHKILDIIGFVFFTLVSLELWKYSLRSKNYYLFSIIPIVSAFSFVFLINFFKKSKTLNFPLLMRIGTLSYSMYLIHLYFARSFSLFLLSKLSVGFNEILTIGFLFVMSVILTYFLAVLSEQYIEKPFIILGRRLIEKIKDPSFKN